MSRLSWGNPGDKKYEGGVDRGVLYLPDGFGVPWNGLVSVVENFKKGRESVYFDGMKISDSVSAGDYSATIRAIHYPLEFEGLESTTNLRSGVLLNDQPPVSFGFSYRTFKGNDLAGRKASYNIHIVFNLTAVPSDKNYSTMSEDPSLTEFEWSVEAVPEEIPGYRPTAHFTIESDKLDPWLLEEVERILYGDIGSYAELPSLKDLFNLLDTWARVKITVNEELGIWTATETRPGFILKREADPDVYDLVQVNAAFVDPEQTEYIIADTKERTDYIEIRVNEDGTWSAITDSNALIEVIDGVFTLKDIEPLMSGPDMFRIKSKTFT